MKYLLIFVLFSCAIQAPINEEKPAPVFIVYHESIDLYKLWVVKRLEQLNKEYHLNITVIVHADITPFYYNETTVWTKFAQFDPDKKQIHIWCYGMDSFLPTILSFDHLKHAFYHEYLHAIDNSNDIKAPADHNDLFDKRIKELGWS